MQDELSVVLDEGTKPVWPSGPLKDPPSGATSPL